MILCALMNCHHGGQKTSQSHEDNCCVPAPRRAELGNSQSGKIWKELCYNVFDDRFTGFFFFLALYTGIIICIKENNKYLLNNEFGPQTFFTLYSILKDHVL